MSDVVKRIAEALAEEEYGADNPVNLLTGEPRWCRYVGTALTAVAVMREPIAQLVTELEAAAVDGEFGVWGAGQRWKDALVKFDTALGAAPEGTAP